MSEERDRQALETLATQLAAHPDFRVVRRLDPAKAYPPLTGPNVSRAAIIDVETTGMEFPDDKVIELALVVFEYDRDSGVVGPVLYGYDGLEDPGGPIPPASTAIHHITDEMVKDQRLDEVRIAELLKNVTLVIAHNAEFDRKFVERRLPVFGSFAWGCSLREVPWELAGIESAKLEYIAYRYGYFYEGHRAESDCRALLEALSRSLGEGGPTGLAALLESARLPTYRLYASNSPFESKEALKARRYRWSPEDRVWWKGLAGAEMEAELAWLKTAVYGGKQVRVDVETLDAKTRYTERGGKWEKVRL